MENSNKSAPKEERNAKNHMFENYLPYFLFRKEILICFFTLLTAAESFASKQNGAVVDKTGTISTEFIRDMNLIQSELNNTNIADFGIVILKKYSGRNLINESILWVDYLELGSQSENEILVLADASQMQIYVHLGLNIQENISKAKIQEIISERAKPWLKSKDLERAIRVTITGILDSLGSNIDLRKIALGNDPDLIKQNPPPVKNLNAMILFILGVILAVALLFYFKKSRKISSALLRGKE